MKGKLLSGNVSIPSVDIVVTLLSSGSGGVNPPCEDIKKKVVLQGEKNVLNSALFS